MCDQGLSVHHLLWGGPSENWELDLLNELRHQESMRHGTVVNVNSLLGWTIGIWTICIWLSRKSLTYRTANSNRFNITPQTVCNL